MRNFNRSFSRRARHTLLRSESLYPRQKNVIIWELSYIIYLTWYTKSLYPEYQMDTIKYHGSSETEIITSRAILIRMRNQVHVDVMISISCLYHTLYIRLQSLIYVPREPGALPLNKKKQFVITSIDHWYLLNA